MKQDLWKTQWQLLKNRVLHMYHTEGANGGHAPDLIKSAAFSNILPSSTNQLCLIHNTVDEHLDMVMITHHFKCGYS